MRDAGGSGAAGGVMEAEDEHGTGPGGEAAAMPGRPSAEEHGGAKTLLKQVAGFVPGALVPAVVALGSTVIFTRVFDSAGFGRYSLALGIAALLTTLATQWLQQGTGRFLPGAHAAGEGDRLKEAIAGAMLAVGCVLALLCAAAIALVGARLTPEWRQMLWPGAALVVAVAMIDPLAVVLQSEMRASRYSVYRVADVVLRLSMGLAVVFLVSRTPAGLLWGSAIAPLVLLPVLWRDSRMPAPWRALARFRALGPDIRRMGTYGLPMVGWFVAAYTMNVSDRYVIQFFRGAGEVGIYSANYSLAAGVGGLITAPVLLATHPLLMRAWDAGRRDVAKRWLGLIVEWYAVAGVLVVGLLVLFSADIAWLLLGAEFRGGHRVLPIAMAGAVAWQFGLYAQKPLEFEGRVRSVLWISVATAALNVAANLVLVPRFGYIAAAFSTVLAYLAYAVLTATLGRRVLPWELRRKELGGTLALCAGGLGLAALGRAWAGPALGYAAGLAVALAVAAVMLGLVARRMIGPLLGRA